MSNTVHTADRFTPGPWEVRAYRFSNIACVAPFQRKRLAVVGGKTREHREAPTLNICIPDAGNGCVGNVQQWHEANANAHLIAAAPDLLAACRAALSIIVDDYNPHAGTHKQLKDAIARATGETP